MLCNFSLAIAEVYMIEGNKEYLEKDFNTAIYFYTEGIRVYCKDEELNAKLYSNRATAHFCLGEKNAFMCFFYSTLCACKVARIFSLDCVI